MAEAQTYDLSITGVSYELAVAAGLPEDLAELGEAKKRGRGWTYSFTGITKFDADTITLYLTDAAANINYLSTSENRAAEAHILRKDAEKIRTALFDQQKVRYHEQAHELGRILGEALEAAMDWMVSEDEDDEDDDGAEIWERVLIPARDAYRASLAASR
jgi:hypothetical protein